MFEDISQTGQSGGLNGGYSDSGQLYKILEGKGKNYNEICTGWHFRNSFEFTLYGLHHALVILKANVEGWESWGGQKLLQGAHCSNISLCVWEFFIITTEIQIAMTSRAIDYALNQGPDVHLWCSLWKRWWESVLPPRFPPSISFSLLLTHPPQCGLHIHISSQIWTSLCRNIAVPWMEIHFSTLYNNFFFRNDDPHIAC